MSFLLSISHTILFYLTIYLPNAYWTTLHIVSSTKTKGLCMRPCLIFAWYQSFRLVYWAFWSRIDCGLILHKFLFGGFSFLVCLTFSITIFTRIFLIFVELYFSYFSTINYCPLLIIINMSYNYPIIVCLSL